MWHPLAGHVLPDPATTLEQQPLGQHARPRLPPCKAPPDHTLPDQARIPAHERALELCARQATLTRSSG